MADKLPGRSRFPNCTIDNVQYGDGFDYLQFDILDADGTYLNKIYVCNRSVQEDLQQLFAKPAICLYWAYGMVDIDVSYKAPDVLFCGNFSAIQRGGPVPPFFKEKGVCDEPLHPG